LWCDVVVVVDVHTVSLFKANLDKFWLNKFVECDFVADLIKIGNRCVHDMSGM